VNIPLTINATNALLLTATDVAGNIGTGSVSIIQDSIPNALIISTANQTINASNITITGSTKANATISITGGSGVTVSGAANGA